MEIYDWALIHWFLTFILVYATMYYIATLVVRTYRLIMILTRGWPPVHLDADGDWPKPLETKE